jgi:hypothetical protein
MRSLEAMLIEVAFSRVDKVGESRRTSSHLWTAAVAEKGRRMNLEVRRQQRHHILPDAPGTGRGMQQNAGRFVACHGQKFGTKIR